MKQVAQNYRSGKLAVIDVPPPACRSGGVLVRSLFSLISTGTEVMKVNEARLSLVGKAKARPDQVRKVLDSVSQQGLKSTYSKAMNRLDSWSPLGYSVAGMVLEVGPGCDEFEVGQLVACAGNEHALHAEVNWVPKNLCAPIPEGVPPRTAAFATVGAIALQGVRRAEPQIGDTACVIGLGLIGQLTVRILVAAGLTVVGLDTSDARCRQAEQGGALAAATPDTAGLACIESVVRSRTGGFGADEVLLTAGGSSNGPVEMAVRLARDRARVVDVGKLSLDLPWNAYYEKEIDFRFSRSYGPGRYDSTYELEGVDYPIGYVRWTERRNIGAFLDLVARGLEVEQLLAGTYPLADAAEVYGGLRSGTLDGVGYLFSYPDTSSAVPQKTRPAAPLREPQRRGHKGTVSVAFVGAGNYASSMLIPHLREFDCVTLAKVVTNTALSATNAQRKFGFLEATTDVEAVLGDPAVDVVFIATRHHSHAELTCRALESGKSVFVEKPLALSGEQLERIAVTVVRTGNDRLMVGFNRRFSPLLSSVRDRLGPVEPGSVLRYLVNAGALEPTSWYRDPEEGSRFVGEGGHFLDTASWWLDSAPIEVQATATAGRDNLHVGVRFANGSLASIDYVTNGHPRFPKETIEVSTNGRTARFDNFRSASLWNGGRKPLHLKNHRLDKGQRSQLISFISCLRTGGPMPISWPSLLATTAATLAVEDSLNTGCSQKV